MKKYGIRVLADDSVIIVSTTGDPLEFAKITNPDVIASGSGTSEDPYIYEPTVELIGELPKDSNGAYIMPDKEYRNSWKASGSDIVIDLASARNEKLAQVRAERDSKLEANDKNWLIASKKGEDTTAIETQAQALRDLPATATTELDALSTLDDIKNYSPDWP